MVESMSMLARGLTCRATDGREAKILSGSGDVDGSFGEVVVEGVVM